MAKREYVEKVFCPHARKISLLFHHAKHTYGSSSLKTGRQPSARMPTRATRMGNRLQSKKRQKMKATLLSLLILLFSCAVSFGSDLSLVVVTGSGATKDEALTQAFQHAVRDVFGAYIYSESSIVNRKLAEEKLLTYSQGYVKDYRILKEQQVENTVVLDVKVDVSIDDIKSVQHEFGLENWDDTLNKLHALSFNQAKLREALHLAQVFMGNSGTFFQRAYKVRLVKYEVTELRSDSIAGNFLVELSLNESFWNRYFSILKTVGREKSWMDYFTGVPSGFSTTGDFALHCPQQFDTEIYVPTEVAMDEPMLTLILQHRPDQWGSKETKLNLRTNGIIVNSRAVFPVRDGDYILCKGGGDNWIAFKSLILGIPFRVADSNELASLLKSNQPWFKVEPSPLTELLRKRR